MIAELQISIAKSVLALSKHGDGPNSPEHSGGGIPDHIKVSDLPSGEGSFTENPSKVPRDGYIDLFHVTSIESLPSIFSDGRLSNEGQDNFQGYKSGVSGVYGWTSLGRAVAEIHRASEQLEISRSSFAIFRIRVPVYDGRLAPDEDSGLVSWKRSYLDGSVALRGGADMDDVVEVYKPRKRKRK